MKEYIIGFLFSVIILFIFSFFLPREKIKKINEQIQQQENEYQEKLTQTINQYNDVMVNLQNIKTTYADYKNEVAQCQFTIDNLTSTKINLIDDISKCGKQLEQAQFTLDEQRKNIQTTLDALYVAEEEKNKLKILNLEKKYDEALARCEKGYEEAAQEINNAYLKKLETYKKQLEEITIKLQDTKDKVDAATEINKHASGEKMELEKYKILIPEEDKKEISVLRSVESQLRNPEALNKIVWTYYYQKPVNALVSRVIGSGVKSGIYKITNLENGMIYIGQAVDLGARWKQHIKRGLGAETPTRNALYPAMKKDGPENFSYEVVEYCSNSDLNNKEKFWIEFYNGKEYGYNLRLG